MNQEGLAGFQAAALEDVVPHRKAGFRQRSCGVRAEARRDREAVRGRGDAVLGIATARGERADGVADGPGVHA